MPVAVVTSFVVVFALVLLAVSVGMKFFDARRKKQVGDMLKTAAGEPVTTIANLLKEAEPEKGSIDKFTEQTGREAAEAIKKPINKAKDIDKMAQERLKNLEKQDAEKSE